MSEIPSHLAISGAQAGLQAQEVSRQSDAQRAGQVDAAKRQVNTVNEADTTVETSDEDVAVFTNAEGGGSQGREEEQPGQDQTNPESTDQPTGGITRDDTGQLHIDIEA